MFVSNMLPMHRTQLFTVVSQMRKVRIPELQRIYEQTGDPQLRMAGGQKMSSMTSQTVNEKGKGSPIRISAEDKKEAYEVYSPASLDFIGPGD
ncbi:hypothetical protein [Bacillus sp. T33-2]|uniref:hypothetical protein n=1 Tax=Bacillus sp. T33-2 TaxID=2054168 RepID=UPI000C76C548|nr:hypothetical protein [Bacillus sp. T33-2]PLR94650.1 hypothetical protein CVD19_16945 [Bacillus sp. T33-2]